VAAYRERCRHDSVINYLRDKRSAPLTHHLQARRDFFSSPQSQVSSIGSRVHFYASNDALARIVPSR